MKIAVISFIVAFALSTPVFAAETGGCDSFAWPIKTELSWLKASDPQAAKSGDKLAAAPEKAIALSLEPMSAVTFPVAPTGRAKAEGDVFGGVMTFDSGASAAGLYQFTMQSGGWLDVVQNGKALKSTAHSGKSDCDGARKSLRFDLAAGPFTVQFSNMKKDQIKFTIRKAE
jgi:hypothetical protein